MNFESLSIVLFLTVLGVLVIMDRKNIEFKFFMITRRTKKGKNKIREIGLRHAKAFKVYASIAIIVAIIASLVGMGFLLKNLTLGEPGVKFLLPKIFPGEPSEGVQKHVAFIPLWYWIITIFIIIVPHELSHGFVAAAEKIRIKSLGLILFLIFPGAFVEPDEDQFRKSRPSTRMKVAAVGSFANFLVFLLLLGVIFGMSVIVPKIFVANGVVFSQTIAGMPAAAVGLRGVLTAKQGQEVRSVDDLSEILASAAPGTEIDIRTTEGLFTVKTVENPDLEGQSFIGVSDVSTKLIYRDSFRSLGNPETGARIFFWFFNLFNGAAFVDINIAIANLSPLLPWDGGLIYQALLEKVFRKDVANKVIVGLSIFTFAVLILNIIGMGKIISLVSLFL